MQTSLFNNVENAPNDGQITVHALPNFANEEIHVWGTHTDSDDGDGYAMVLSCNGEEGAFGRELEDAPLASVEKSTEVLCSGRRAYCDLPRQ